MHLLGSVLVDHNFILSRNSELGVVVVPVNFFGVDLDLLDDLCSIPVVENQEISGFGATFRGNNVYLSG